MRYVISDTHGCYEEFMLLLEKINFSDKDELYLLGDIMDRGPESIRLIQEMMAYPNIYPILGNHDYMAHKILTKLDVEITDDAIQKFTEEDMLDYMHWMKDGGCETANQFVELDLESRKEILDYIQDFSLYEDITVGDKRYVLVHAGIEPFDEKRKMSSYRPEELIFHRADYGRRYFTDNNTYLITGHTPTFAIRSDGKSLIYQEYGHIAIDCGCVYGGRLAAFCLDNGECFYVDGRKLE